MRQVTMVLLAWFVGGCLMGCVLVGEKTADVGVEFNSGLRFYQTAPEGGSRLEADLLPWVREEIKARREAEMLLKMKAAAAAETAVEDDG